MSLELLGFRLRVRVNNNILLLLLLFDIIYVFIFHLCMYLAFFFIFFAYCDHSYIKMLKLFRTLWVTFSLYLLCFLKYSCFAGKISPLISYEEIQKYLPFFDFFFSFILLVRNSIKTLIFLHVSSIIQLSTTIYYFLNVQLCLKIRRLFKPTQL